MEDGKLALITPEGVTLKLTPAGPLRRGWAWLIDTTLFLFTVIVVSLALRGSMMGNGLYLLALFLIYWGYPILCEVYFNGQTVGKRLLKLQVVRQDGLAVSWRESTLRNLMLVADFMPALYAAGLLTMLLDRRFRRLGDIVGGTLVIYREAPLVRPVPADVEAIALPIALTAEEQRALLDFVERSHHLSEARLRELADLASPLTGMTGHLAFPRLESYAASLTRSDTPS